MWVHSTSAHVEWMENHHHWLNLHLGTIPRRSRLHTGVQLPGVSFVPSSSLLLPPPPPPLLRLFSFVFFFYFFMWPYLLFICSAALSCGPPLMLRSCLPATFRSNFPSYIKYDATAAARTLGSACRAALSEPGRHVVGVRVRRPGETQIWRAFMECGKNDCNLGV